MPKDTIKTSKWVREKGWEKAPPPPPQMDGIHFGPGERPDSWDKEHSGLWHAAMAPSVAALKIHAVWCRHTSQLSGRGRGRKDRERKRGDRHIDRYNLKHLSRKRGGERLKQGRERWERMSESNREEIDKGAHRREGRVPPCSLQYCYQGKETWAVYMSYSNGTKASQLILYMTSKHRVVRWGIHL